MFTQVNVNAAVQFGVILCQASFLRRSWTKKPTPIAKIRLLRLTPNCSHC